MTLNGIRSVLYVAARLLGDVNAVRKGKIGQRIVRRVVGKVLGRGLARLFR